MVIDKDQLKQQVLNVLQENLETAQRAAKQARDSATHEESVAENKYDTLGLEASYLAEGHSRRVAECEQALAVFEKFTVRSFSEDAQIGTGALVELLDEDEEPLIVFLSPVGGGLKLEHAQLGSILLLTPESPLGKALKGKEAGDEIILSINHQNKVYEILSIA